MTKLKKYRAYTIPYLEKMMKKEEETNKIFEKLESELSIEDISELSNIEYQV